LITTVYTHNNMTTSQTKDGKSYSKNTYLNCPHKFSKTRHIMLPQKQYFIWYPYGIDFDGTLFAEYYSSAHSTLEVLMITALYKSTYLLTYFPSVPWCCWLAGRKSIQPVKT